MVRIVVDKEMCDRLGGLDEQLEIFDENGRVLGRFLPVALRDPTLAEVEAQCPYTPEELDAMEERAAREGGRPLAEIWKELGVK